MLFQWQEELETRFGLTFEIIDKDYMKRIRRERGFSVNPWTTHSRFLISHRLLIDEAYTGPLRDWLGAFRSSSLLILDEAHHAYFAYRAALMVENNEGLTKTYNRFHDPTEKSPKIIKLRELHAAMDCAVLEAYGWNDLTATAKCEFLLDYEDDEDGQESSRRKKPWRYRWSDDFRDEVIARLLELNAQRAKVELVEGKKALGTEKKPIGKTRMARTTQISEIPGLFPDE